MTLIILLTAAGAGVWYFLNTSKFSIEKTRIGDTATRIKEVKQIGQWEFLTIDCEVLVDSTRKRPWPLPDDRLARIYRGTLRLGVDLKDAPDNWVETKGDTLAILHLPAIALLDNRFIDEARTTAFYERGDWKGESLESMYRRASDKMKGYALTPAHYEDARRVAESKFTTLFNAIGFKKVEVDFSE